MVKMLVSDFDNTLFIPKYFDANIKAVNNFIDDNHIFVIASGRHSRFLINDVKKYKIKFDYLICNDGGIIFDKNLNIIFQRDIPQKLVVPICNTLDSMQSTVDWYVDTGTNLVKDKTSNANGIICRINDHEEAEKMLSYITKKYYGVHGYMSYYWINITEKSIDKGTGIAFLKKRLNINDEDIYTIGDNINDIPMSTYNSFCVPNSHPELQKLCKKTYNLYELTNYIKTSKI